MGLREQGFSIFSCRDFDRSVELFDMWIENRQEQTKFVTSPPQPPKGKSIGKRFGSLNELLGLETPEDEREREILDSLSPEELDLSDALSESDDALESFLANLGGVGSAV